MCGIAGAVFMNGVSRSEEMKKQIRLVFNEMFVNTQSRGEHATGLVHFKRSGGYDFHKAAKSAQEMITHDETYNQIIDSIGDETFSIIGHTRYYTQGLPKNNNNNHPFDIGNVIGVHNGTVANDHFLFKDYKKSFTRIAEVDSEIIYQLINHYNKEEITNKGLSDALEKTGLRGAFALAFSHKNQPNIVHIVKQERPMVLALWQEAGIVFFNSQEDFISSAFDSLVRSNRAMGLKNSPHTVEYSTLKNDTYLTIDANMTEPEEIVTSMSDIYLMSNSVKTYTKAYTNNNTNIPLTLPSTSIKSVTAKDSIGRVIEGELDEITGEIILYAPTSNDKGSYGYGANYCTECGNKLQDYEITATYNGSNPNDELVCSHCYQQACTSLLTGV